MNSQTFKTDCEMFKEACEEGEADFELLEHNACEGECLFLLDCFLSPH